MEITATLSKIDSSILADYILKNYGPMSHLKLQKLLFYCDAYHMAYFGEELVTDEFEAWAHGPVSRTIYNSLKDKSILYSDLSYSDKGINPDDEIKKLTSDQQIMLKEILGELSSWTGPQLEASTHREYPWIEARKGYGEGAKCSVSISKKTTLEFYKREING
ncbi:DUF4065 domain-containing protein [Dysgonomonas sp. Shenzhen-Wh21]|uniref:Panacea domain-containing protein n=1 Tax=Dysgonomonas TaxID=156973 RepID=UPI00208EF24E|nr:type II toxin-antitoxin system antitoxin SocA domain-containing protein [Dysgonomonas mossii]